MPPPIRYTRSTPVIERAEMTLTEVERRHILFVLERCDWNRERAAKALGIGLRTIYRKIKEYGL